MENKLEIKFGDKKIVAEINDWCDGGPKELTVYLRDKDNCIISPNLVGLEVSQLLLKQIIQEHPEAKDTSKLLTPDICFINKIYVEEHLNDENVLKYQTELNNLLNMVSEIKDNTNLQTDIKQ